MNKMPSKKWGHKILASFMSFFMVLSLIPISSIHVWAVDNTQREQVKIKVVDEAGNPVQGAKVEFIIDTYSEGPDKYMGMKNTNEEGIANILDSINFEENNLLVSVKVTMSGYQMDDTTIWRELIVEGNQCMQVTLTKINVTCLNTNYDEKEWDGVTVTGYDEERDTVYYQLEGEEEWSLKPPKLKYVGEYPIRVKIERKGKTYYESGEHEFTAVIDKGQFQINLEPYMGSFDEKKHLIVNNIETSGLRETDTLVLTMTYTDENGNETSQKDNKIPEIYDAGTYHLELSVHRDDNYEDAFCECTAVIQKAEVGEEGIKPIYQDNLVYDGKEQLLVKKIEGLKEGDEVEYRIDNGEWSKEAPKRIDAGSYQVEIKIIINRVSNYNQKEIELEPVTVTIKKGEWELKFKENHGENITYDENNKDNNLYDFSVVCESDVPYITYKLENGSKQEEIDSENKKIEDIAEIDERGKLSIKADGGYNLVVSAVAGEDNNHVETTIQYGMVLKYAKADLIKFQEQEISYIVSGKSSEISKQTGEKTYSDDRGKITYSAKINNSDKALQDIGICIDKESGVLCIAGENEKEKQENYKKLGEEIEKFNKGDKLEIEVTAEKTVGEKYHCLLEKEGEVYPSCVNSYKVKLSFCQLPEAPYTVCDMDGKPLETRNGWYNTNIYIKAAEGYCISKECDPAQFGEAVEVCADDAKRIKFYLMNLKTKEITSSFFIENKIDIEKPIDIQIQYFINDENKPEYPASYCPEMIHFFQSHIIIKFMASDALSGVESFSWKYNRTSDASTINLEALNGILEAQETKESNQYSATLMLPKSQENSEQALLKLMQLRGCISVSATDRAGNTSEEITGDKIVVDSISPERTVTYQLKDKDENRYTDGKKQYFSDDVEFTFQINEANFFSEKVEVYVSQNGGKKTKQEIDWERVRENEDEYSANMTLSEDGEYIVSMKYEDCSGNKMQEYQSETIVVDKTDPVISFSYADYENKKEPQTATITIKEKNFRKSDICVSTSAKNISGGKVQAKDLQNYLQNCKWTSKGDVHTAQISSQFVDAIYELTFDYTDLALRKAAQVKTNTFIVDHKAPSTATMTAEYSTSVKDTILSNITFGFYNSSVTITFTAYDITSGIDYFTWNYQRQKGASKSNVEQYSNMKVKAVQDKENKAKYTASVTLPKTEAKQLRGNITFTATDKCNNTSGKITDTKHVIVVDTVAPSITAEYTQADRVIGGKRYYSEAMKAIFTVREANFYSEDIVVKICKNGEKEKRVKVSWKEASKDMYVGTYSIKAPENHTGDGDYTIKVEYMDRSSNKMKTYTSKPIVIDTISPVIDVSYSQKNPNLTLQDGEGNRREYYSVSRTAIITVKEHNFNAKDIVLSIGAKDIAGNLLDVQSHVSQSKWKSKKDIHTMTISYEGNANYIFDISYKDLANNTASEYHKDYFTIDDEHPDSLSVSYSTSVLDTILSNISFGFYNAKTTVTIGAKDSISGVQSFQYRYIDATEGSSNNDKLESQVIEETDIHYSDKGAAAFSTFKIPREAVGEESQFNGTVSFLVSDRAGNQSDYLQDTKRIIVDSISPTATVEYNKPVNREKNISYYDGDITATVTVKEANFYPDDMVVSVSRDGKGYAVSPMWIDKSADKHIGEFMLTGDGNYFVTISYTDKSNNSMKVYTSQQLTIDTQLEEPVIKVNGKEGDRQAFKGQVIPEVSFEDDNFDSYKISLTKTRNWNKDKDVTNKLSAHNMILSERGGRGSFDNFSRTRDNDGIYTMKVSIYDKAGHTKEKTVKFTVNRFGSVYEYSDNLVQLIKDGGAYIQEVETDFLITEYNADHLVSDSLYIEISKDGRPIDNPLNSISDMSDTIPTGKSGWYAYQYIIHKENFNRDGVYKIAVSSRDKTGNESENVPENTNYKDNSILFYVDSTKPEIDSITGLENQIVNAASVDVEFTAYDTVGLKSISVYVNGEETNKITDFSGDKNNYLGGFTLSENPSAQSVRLVVTDLAGNTVNTDDDDFSSVYSFHRKVTVSTNFFVRLYADKILFWRIVGGITTVIVAMMGLAVLIKKKYREKL